jgi:uncharacterized protein
MVHPVTYNLSPVDNRGNFYDELQRFTNQVRLAASIQLGRYVEDYYSYIIDRKIEDARHKDEYLLEIIITGVLAKNYYTRAQKVSSISTSILGTLYSVRKQNQSLKPTIDKARGILSYLWLNKTPSERSPHYSTKGFAKLLEWLSATGEFNEEVIRLEQWARFYKLKTEDYLACLLESAIVFTDYFERKGEERLGRYLCNVTHFLQNRLRTYRFKEDYFFVARKRNEYFMNMFGAEIMNRCMEYDFKKMPNKAVLLPACMRTPPSTGCLARHDGKELVCMQCNRNCNVGRVATAMKKYKVKCYLIPHSSGFSRFLEKWESNTDTALVGVTCILNLLTGGYEMKRLSISSQCVFLDYCGCKKHWDTDGTPTTLNLQQLMQIVN